MDDPLECQFCGEHPGRLLFFANAWSCARCLETYGMEDHSMMMMYQEYGCGDYYIYHYKPIMRPVTIKELPCDPEDLQAGASYYVFNIREVDECQTEVEIWL
jgi:hypothetical protein